LQAQLAHTRAGINQDIIVQQQRGGAPRTTDSGITAEHGKFHFPSRLATCTGDLNQALTVARSAQRIKTELDSGWNRLAAANSRFLASQKIRAGSKPAPAFGLCE